LLAAACGGGSDRAASPEERERPKQTAKRISLTETDMGIPRWKLDADQVASYSGRQAVYAENVHVDFFDEEGLQVSVLTSREGRLDSGTNNMTAIGDVVVRNTDGYTLETDSLRWVSNERLVRTEAFVRLTRGEDVLTGYGLVSDPGLEHFEIQRRVSGRTGNVEEPLEGR
jgi:LPS export ABC transporter protein LptC